MSKKTNGVKWNKSSKTKQRRKSVIERLESQLKIGTKPAKKSQVRGIPLTDSDIKRINKEIEILRTRI